LNSPFNEVKYKALLEGLEVSEVFYSKIPFGNSIFRIDAEYFQKKYLREDLLLSNYETVYLGEDAFITDGQHGYHVVDENSEIRHLTAKNFKNWFADDINADRLAKWVDENNKRSSLEVNDIVLTTRGSVGYCALVKENVLPANIDQDVARISIKNKNRIKPQFFITYLNSKYGQDWILRNQTGMVQQGLALWRVREIPIPLLNINFQKVIEKTIEFSYSLIVDSKNKYTQAEEILLEEMGLKDFEPSNEPVNIKSFKDSFLASGRLDAEYYQKKYEGYIKLIKNYKHGFEPFSKVCNLKDKNYSPNETKQYKYIELANIGKTGDINGCTTSLGKDLPTRARRIVSENDVIISSIEGSLDSCALITKEYDNALCSTGFYVVNSDKINSETLLILFKSEPMQNILKKSCSGTILTAINKTELEKIPIPLIDYTKQQQIAELIEESFALKKQSEKLLETTKRVVEIAIEENEEKAIKYINSKVS